MVAPTVYVPPTCPHCDEELLIVREVIHNTFVFDKDTGTYDERGTQTTTCAYCDGELDEYEVPGFEDGVCNYIHSSK